ncbi:SPOR domain-containing protein [Brevundimonas sp. NPDC092305]|uniref:SPOR domain-containing protein n=1 Tax=Brevundimonas sp. NPDC092305 TaxID=3363957 RepID=UPI0038212BF9
MSNDDPYRPNPGRDYGRDRGAYTPPTDDDLPFDRQSYDPRRTGGGGGPGRGGGGGGRGGPPVTLIISAVVLLALIIAVVVYYRAGPRASGDAPPAVGTPVREMTAEAPVDAQPVDPEAGIDVYSGATPPTTDPTYAPPPEEVGPRPAAQPIEAATPLPPAATRPATPAPAPTPTAPPPAKTQPSAVPSGGSSGVQIGAFSTPSLAEREYNAVVGRYSRLTQGATRRVQEVQTASGATVYRTTVGNLSREQATGLCAAIRDAGGDCLVR